MTFLSVLEHLSQLNRIIIIIMSPRTCLQLQKIQNRESCNHKHYGPARSYKTACCYSITNLQHLHTGWGKSPLNLQKIYPTSCVWCLLRNQRHLCFKNYIRQHVLPVLYTEVERVVLAHTYRVVLAHTYRAVLVNIQGGTGTHIQGGIGTHKEWYWHTHTEWYWHTHREWYWHTHTGRYWHTYTVVLAHTYGVVLAHTYRMVLVHTYRWYWHT